MCAVTLHILHLSHVTVEKPHAYASYVFTVAIYFSEILYSIQYILFS